MPPGKNVPSLYFLSLTATVPQLKRLRSDSSNPGKEWPLDKMPGTIIEDLMDFAFIRKLYLNNEVDWRIFLTPHIERAIISFDHKLFNYLHARCQKLKQLYVLPSDSGVHVSDLLCLMKSVPRVCICESFFCYRAVRNFELWRSLVSSSRLVAYNWIWSPVYYSVNMLTSSRSVVDANNEYPTELYLTDSDLSVEDIQTILEYCPKIRVLRHEYVVPALYLRHRTTKVEELPRYELRNLDMTFFGRDEFVNFPSYVTSHDAAVLAAQLCPEAEILRLKINDNTPGILLHPFFDLRKIEELSIWSMSSHASLNQELYTLLTKHGRTMRRLELTCMLNIDLELILCLCPNLEYLGLVGNSYSPVTSNTTLPEVLPALKILCIRGVHNIPTHLWQYLLGGNAKRIMFVSGDNIPPLRSAVLEACWENLLILRIEKCEHLQANHVVRLLSVGKSLCRIHIQDCRNLGREEFRLLEKHIIDKGIHVTLSVKVNSETFLCRNI